ncbi:hypothetical protein ACIRU3_40910 [Streptomyces sp. NPDC101151]|uniref:hypothetical protein n=1 Tax=Streptomyces sp. NPDC101151 TaxID=3366115 RepID=UPI0037FEEEA2
MSGTGPLGRADYGGLRRPEVPERERERILERLRRGPADSPGGLTLVAPRAALQRGAVTVGDAPGGTGACFEVRRPSEKGEPRDRRDWLIATVGAYRSQSFPKEGF